MACIANATETERETGIEVTPEMIGVGIDLLREFDLTFEGEETWVERIYVAMRLLEPQSGSAQF